MSEHTESAGPGAATEAEFTEGVTRPGSRHLIGYNPEVAAIVLDAVASGKTVKDVCAGDVRLPSAGTVRRWVVLNIGRDENEQGVCTRLGFGDQMMTALELQAESMADDCLSIADEEETTEVVGDTVVTRNSIAHRNLRISTRKYLMAANARAKWGMQKGAAVVPPAPLRINSAIRRGPNDPLLLEGVVEPVDVERPATGGLVLDGLEE